MLSVSPVLTLALWPIGDVAQTTMALHCLAEVTGFEKFSMESVDAAFNERYVILAAPGSSVEEGVAACLSASLFLTVRLTGLLRFLQLVAIHFLLNARSDGEGQGHFKIWWN